MIEKYLRQSPLAHLGLGGQVGDDAPQAGVRLAERPVFGFVNLRGPGADPAFLDAFKAAAGYALPGEAGMSGGDGDTTALWLGPKEWAIVDTRGDPDAGPRIAGHLRTALTGYRVAVTDMSESRACIEISGAKARATLQKGCPLDLHPHVFRPGQCAQTRLAKTTVLIHLTAGGSEPDGPAFDVYAVRSFAEYVWLWLEDAAREYGVTTRLS
jgi:sarcosine oxidase, subunit gamma